VSNRTLIKGGIVLTQDDDAGVRGHLMGKGHRYGLNERPLAHVFSRCWASPPCAPTPGGSPP